MTSKERAALKAQAMKIDSIFQIGKSSLSPSQVDAIRAAFQTRELVKIHVLKNCTDHPAELAVVIAERTGSQVVQVIGKKIVLYKKNVRIEEKKKKAADLKDRKNNTSAVPHQERKTAGRKGRAKRRG